MTLSGIYISLRVVGNIFRSGRDGDLTAYLSLEGFEYHLLELIGPLRHLLGTDSFVTVVGDLLGLEADTSMKLHLEPLAGVPLDPLAVDAFVLLTGPGILELMQLEAFTFQAFDVRPDTLSVASIAVLKGVTDRI